MHDLTFVELMKISLVMPVLLVLSILLVAVFLERIIFYFRMASVDVKMFQKVKALALDGKHKEARELCAQHTGLIAEAMESVMSAAGKKRDDLESILTLHYQRIQTLLARRLGLFGTLSFISPLLGLLGTVLGVMRAFRDLALSGSGGPTIVAAGISEALIATAAGIAVAVSAAILYNYFNFKMRHVLNSLNLFGQEIMIILTTGKDI
ncbi:MAG TPA: MotA/TolQ/ExbB proton channel family protein [Elusimicrobiota bacterium]|nr:MotA/TolQ/ExbB proton channel family protein [Elusimicrobiota bacterium]